MTAPTGLVVEALRAEAQRRHRAGLKLALELEGLRTSGTDVRTRAVRLVTWLAGAAQLDAEADRLEAGPPLRGADVLAGALAAAPSAQLAEEQDRRDAAGDGLSPEANAAADLAHLEPTVLVDGPEDPLTGATPEDEPADVDLDALAEVGS